MAISIKARFRNSMLGLSLVLCAVFTMLLFIIVFTTEDQVFVNQMSAEKKLFDLHQSQNPTVEWEPSNRRFLLASSIGALPDSVPLKDRNRIAQSIGIHEYFDSQNALFIHHFNVADSSRFLVYDVSDLLAVRGNKLPIFISIIIATLLVTVVAVLVARRLVRTTLEPVRKLSHEVQQGDLDGSVIELANEFSDDEIGVLAKELAVALSKAKNAAQREYEFNRGVSHELRSPIQVARSATELLELHVEDQTGPFSNYVARLKRSVLEMNEVADAFLWLASERQLSSEDRCSLGVLRQKIDSVKAAMATQVVNIETELVSSFEYPLPANVAAVIIRSLLRNAIAHGSSSPIVIELLNDSIVVSNEMGSATKRSEGFGIGLSIVERICDRLSCTLKTDVDKDSRYRVSVVFR